ncbi:MAG: inorganic phosphate transporter, partial [Syntrophobacteria bacterium]
MTSLLGGIFLGWSLGANSAANVFGTAVTSRMVKFWTAAILASSFVLAGALLGGQSGIETLKGLT